MTAHLVPILWATWQAVASACRPLRTDELFPRARTRFPFDSQATEVDVHDAAATLVVTGLLARDGDLWVPGPADPQEFPITSRTEIEWWRGRRRRQAAERRAERPR